MQSVHRKILLSLSENIMRSGIIHTVLACLVVHHTDGCIKLIPRPPPQPPTTTTQAPTTTTAPGCKCGVPLVNRKRDKIVGGQPAEKNEYSWLVGLVYKFSKSPFCGGSLITSNTVLTAAHCKEFITLFRLFRVHVGEHDVTLDEGEIKIDASLFEIHPDYDEDSSDFDFGIVRLVRHVTFYIVSSICLPNPR